MSYYKGTEYGQIVGILPGPPPAGDYYWWEGGALWGALVDYWHLTGDTKWNDVAQQSLVFQAGAPEYSYMPPNWTISLGNDDQGFWGMSAMLAAETNFQNPPADEPQWLALAQAVFNTQAAPDRHDLTCNGGLRWQIPPSNRGYDYKNSIANGIFFNLGARLARYTENATYAEMASNTWDWEVGVGLMDQDYNVFDGAHVEHNCTDIDKAQYSYSAAVFLQGAAFMYNYVSPTWGPLAQSASVLTHITSTQTSGSDIWRGRLQGLVNQTILVFFPDGGAAVERSCEEADKIQCTTDMKSFKGYLHRWMANAAQLAPFISDQIVTVLKNSTAAAVQSCVDGVDNGNGVSDATCGFRWTTGGYDGDTGAGQQMNVLGALTSLLIAVEPHNIGGPVTNSTGGTSPGNADAGGVPSFLKPASPPGIGDKAGAGALTAVLLISMVLTLTWMSTNRFEGT